MREIEIMSYLSHPHVNLFIFQVIKTIETFVDNDIKCIILEYAEFGTLEDYLKKTPILSNEEIGSYVAQIADGIRYIHKMHVIHRDIKTANIFMFAPNAALVKLADFGISKILEPKSLTSTMVGTPYYLSPETISAQPYGYPSDMWSFGCLIYEILEGRLAFSGSSFAEVIGSVCSVTYEEMVGTHYNPKWRDIVQSLLTYDPDQRPTIDELCENPLIKSYLPKEDTSPRHASRSLTQSPRGSRSRRGSSLVGRLSTTSFKSTINSSNNSRSQSPASTPGGTNKTFFNDFSLVRKKYKTSITEATFV